MRYFKLKIKTIIILFPAVTLFPFASSADSRSADYAFSGILNFFNHDRMHGYFFSINENDKILWKYKNVTKLINFSLKDVDSIKLDNPYRNTENIGDTTINLTNGDLIPGNIVSMDKDMLIYSTVFAGILKIPRAMIREITYLGSQKKIYQGPKKEDIWRQEIREGQKIEIKDGIIKIPSRGWPMLDVKLPDNVRIDFTVISPGNETFLQIFLFTFSGSNGYLLNQQGSYFEFERITEAEGSDSMNDVVMNKILKEPNLKVSILINKKNKELFLLLNDKLKMNAKDNYENFAGNGSSIGFFNVGRIPVELKDISITEWDGWLPNDKTFKPKHNDIIYFINKDKSRGELLGIRDKTVFMNSEFGELKIPLSRVNNLVTATKYHRLARRNKRDIQMFLPFNKRITINLQKFSNGKITGSSENFGKGEFDIKYFTKLRFNIYQERNNSVGIIDNSNYKTNDLFKDLPVKTLRPRERIKIIDPE